MVGFEVFVYFYFFKETNMFFVFLKVFLVLSGFQAFTVGLFEGPYFKGLVGLFWLWA